MHSTTCAAPISSGRFRKPGACCGQGGLLCLLDFGRPHTAYAYAIALVLRQFQEIADNIAGRLPRMMNGAGFVRVSELARYTTVFDTVSLYRGYKERVAAAKDAA